MQFCSSSVERPCRLSQYSGSALMGRKRPPGAQSRSPPSAISPALFIIGVVALAAAAHYYRTEKSEPHKLADTARPHGKRSATKLHFAAQDGKHEVALRLLYTESFHIPIFFFFLLRGIQRRSDAKGETELYSIYDSPNYLLDPRSRMTSSKIYIRVPRRAGHLPVFWSELLAHRIWRWPA